MEVALHELPSVLLEEARRRPRRHTQVPEQGVSVEPLAVGSREVRQRVHGGEIERAGSSLDGVPLHLDFRREAVALAQDQIAEGMILQHVIDADRRTERELVPGVHAGQRIIGSLGVAAARTRARNR